MFNKIKDSIEKFDLNLNGLNVLTEASSGNYVVTPIIAAIAGANVTAITQPSKYASISEVKEQTLSLAKKFHVEDKITIVENKKNISYEIFDVVTNTGFVRPINKDVIELLSPTCVIPLMWEPWEYREEDLDLNACADKGIKVYGTNESDVRLQTMSYIGYIALKFLLDDKKSPFSANILLLGNIQFAQPIINVLKQNNYKYDYISDYEQTIDIKQYNTLILAENANNKLLIGNDGFIENCKLAEDVLIIHICGNVDFSGVPCKTIPKNPAKYGYMSFTTDYIDNKAVIDLHTAGLKVAEGMIKANKKNIMRKEYKHYMQTYYPALAFDEERYW